MVLWIPAIGNRFRLQGCHFVSPSFPAVFDYRFFELCRSEPPRNKFLRFGLFRVRSPLLTKSLIYFLFLRVMRCFSSPGSPLPYYVFIRRYRRITVGGFPHSEICGSRGLFAAPRSLSQLVTSFFGAWCQGIHPMPLLALIVYANLIRFTKCKRSCYTQQNIFVNRYTMKLFVSIVLL